MATDARQVPAHADAKECERDCTCRECLPDLTDDQRQRAGEWERRACGCFVCRESLRMRRRERLLAELD